MVATVIIRDAKSNSIPLIVLTSNPINIIKIINPKNRISEGTLSIRE